MSCDWTVVRRLLRETFCLQPYQFLAGRLAARLVEGEMHLHPLSDKDLIRDLVSEIAPPAERLFGIPPLYSKDIY